MHARPQAWLAQARNDLELSRLASDQGFQAQACFFASQAAENALKGANLELGVAPAHTHQLTEVVDSLQELGVPTDVLRTLRLKPLSRMATSTRYPNDATPPMQCFDRRDAEEAIACAAAVLAQLDGWDNA